MTGDERLREALEALRPFAGCTTTEDGEPRRDEDWPPMTERIVDWFGWSDFRAAVAAFDAIREALAAVPEAPEPERLPKWQPGDAVYWRDRLTVWTVQAGPCVAGLQFVHITAPGCSAVAWQDELVLVDPLGERVEEGTER